MVNLKNFLTTVFNGIFFFGLAFKSKIYPGFIINKKDLVIDLGCGDKPFWRADVFLDKLSLGDEQRFSSTAVVKDIGLFVNSDVTKTPFKNKTFDFSFCSHLLEHVDRPDLAIQEIVRISKRGYIEIPHGLVEMIFPYQSHLWFVFLINDELFFVRKSKKLHAVLETNGFRYSYLVKFMRDPFIRFYWQNGVKYKVIDDLKEGEEYFPSQDVRYMQPYFVQKLYLLIVKVLRRFLYKSKVNKINILKRRLRE